MLNATTIPGIDYDEDWLNQTPPEEEYCLLFLDGEGEHQQEITMTRSEYISLKRELARMRGLTPNSPKDS